MLDTGAIDVPPLPMVPLPSPPQLPMELRNSTAWIVWRAEWRWNKSRSQWKLNKIPCDAGGRTHAMTDPAIRSGLTAALRNAEHLRTQKGTHFGIGLTFCAVDGFYALDLDGDLINGKSERLTWLDTRYPSWGEKSVSGRGAHLFFRGSHTGKSVFAWRGSNVEVFGSTGFVAMTGNVIDANNTSLADGSELLATILAESEEAKAKSKPRAEKFKHNGQAEASTNGANPGDWGAWANATSHSGSGSDQVLIDRMFESRVGARIKELWDGGGASDVSAGDLSLCGHLAFWVGGPDEESIDRLFRQSARMREKWDEIHAADGSTYGQMTIRKSLEGRTEFRRPSASERQYSQQNGKAHADASSNQTPCKWPAPVYVSELSDEDGTINYTWDGCIAKGHITLLSALMKAGKSTFIGHFLRCLQAGEPFIGRATKKSNTLVVTEESKALWCERRDALCLDDHLSVLCRPLIAKPNFADWMDFVVHVQDHAVERQCDLVVFDTLGAFAPWKSENDAAEVQGTMNVLTRLTEAGLAVLLVHHIGKVDGREGKAARGSTALAGAVDVLLELRRYKADEPKDRRRVLRGLGRFDGVPEEVVITLKEDGTGYTAEGDRKAIAACELNAAILGVLPVAPPGMKADEVHAGLPESGRPRRGDVMTALRAGAGAGLWMTAGQGKPSDPRRFWRMA